MATVTTAAVTRIPSFTGLKATGSSTSRVSALLKPSAAAPSRRLVVKASLKDVGVAVAATAASAILASNALAVEVLLGAADGTLVFEPSNFSVPSGEEIVFKNNIGYPHNVVFDEDEVPSGVDATKISMPEEILLNAPGETYAVTLTKKGITRTKPEPKRSLDDKQVEESGISCPEIHHTQNQGPKLPWTPNKLPRRSILVNKKMCNFYSPCYITRCEN